MKKIFFLLVAGTALATTSFAQVKKIKADGIIGVVGDRVILESDVKNAIADAQRQGAAIPENPECVILEQALVSKVLMLQAEKDSLPVGEEEIEAELDQRVRYFINAYGTQEELERIAGKTIYQIKDDARESVKENKLAQAMQKKIVENVRITPTEVQAFFNKIPKDSLPFFETELEIGQIVVYPKPSRDLEKYVIDEMQNYKRQIEAKTATFEQLVKNFSEDPGSKDRGGQYQVNRTEKIWDPAFLSAAFRLKEGEISSVVKSKSGFHIIQMMQRNGDNAVVRHILRKAPVTDEEIRAGVSKLDSVRAKLIAGTIDFSTAAGRYSDDETAKFSGPYITSRDGDTYNTIDELDKEVVTQLGTLRVGEYSQPLSFTNERGDKGVRVLYLKTKTEPHRMNIKDDFNKISTAALEEKKAGVMDKWMVENISKYYIMIDPSIDKCGQLQKWEAASKVAAR
ncbi:MAG: peptidylprolyl isomerase [Flaviaesturariibacter sp.]|nr:peptidylprolyl isomerase [Flaviaesturariibacter sp.]